MSDYDRLNFVVGDHHRNKTTHNLASLPTSPPSGDDYFMVGKYTPFNLPTILLAAMNTTEAL